MASTKWGYCGHCQTQTDHEQDTNGRWCCTSCGIENPLMNAIIAVWRVAYRYLGEA